MYIESDEYCGSSNSASVHPHDVPRLDRVGQAGSSRGIQTHMEGVPVVQGREIIVVWSSSQHAGSGEFQEL